MKSKLIMGQGYDGALQLSAFERLGGAKATQHALEDAGFEDVTVFWDPEEIPDDFPDEIEAVGNTWARGVWGRTTTNTELPPQVIAITEYDGKESPPVDGDYPEPPETWSKNPMHEKGFVDLNPGEVFYVAVVTSEDDDDDDPVLAHLFEPFEHTEYFMPSDELPDPFFAYSNWVANSDASRFVVAKYTMKEPMNFKMPKEWTAAVASKTGPIGIDGKYPTIKKGNGGGGGKGNGGGGGTKKEIEPKTEETEPGDSGKAALGMLLAITAMALMGALYYRKKHRRRNPSRRRRRRRLLLA